MMSATGNTRLLRTPGRYGYSVKFSPFSPSLMAVATGQNFGLSGGGNLLVMDLGLPGSGQVCCCEWQDGLFDLTWSEQNPKCVVSAAGDGSLQVWDTAQPQVPVKVYKEHTREAACVEWSQTRGEELFLSASWDTTLRLWDPNHQSSLVTLAGHEGLVYQAAWSPHLPGCVASASGDGTLRIWNMRRPQAGASMVVRACGAGEVLSCDWSKYNQNLIVTSGTDCNICGWDLRQPAQPVFVLQGHQYPARRVKCSPFQETQLASVSYDFTTRKREKAMEGGRAAHPVPPEPVCCPIGLHQIIPHTAQPTGCSGVTVTTGDEESVSGKPVKRSYSYEREMSDNSEDMDSDGYHLVQHNKKKIKHRVSDSASTSAEFTQCVEPSVDQTVTRQETFHLLFPKGVSPRDGAQWLAEVAHKHRNLSVQPRLTARSIMAVTRDRDTVKFLTEVGHPYKDTMLTLTMLTEKDRQTKAVIRNYPSYLSVAYIEELPSVLWARRTIRRDNKEPMNQVIVMWKGEPPVTIQLPGMRPYKVEKYVGKPTFCSNCQKWGHKVWQCDAKAKCGFCSGTHDSKLCREKIDIGENVTPRCPNCYQEHNAWSVHCPMRPDYQRLLKNKTKGHLTPPPLPPTITDFPLLPQAHTSPPPRSPSPPPRIASQPNQNNPPHASQVTAAVTIDGHHAAPPVPPTTQCGPVARENHAPTPTSLPNAVVTAANAELTRELTSLCQEMQAMKVVQDKLQQENQEMKALCTSMHSMQQTMVSELTSIRKILTQLVGASRPLPHRGNSYGFVVDLDVPHTTPPRTHHPPVRQPGGGKIDHPGHHGDLPVSMGQRRANGF